MALALSAPDWNRLGLDGTPDSDEDYPSLAGPDQVECTVERVVSLLLVRIVAVLVQRGNSSNNNTNTGNGGFADFSCTTVCRTVLLHQKPWMAYAPAITDNFLRQLGGYVRTIVMGYVDTPYHCKEHAFHVVLSVNKLTDLMLQQKPTKNSSATFGLRRDTIAQLALLFAALVHDVEHKGVPNRQLVLEHDPLAVLYNDHSVAEQRSLYVAFSVLLKPEFTLLRQTVFAIPHGAIDSNDYRRFRQIVINLVLNTDIASPERSQLSKSKWKEAFGDPFESMERKLKQELNEAREQQIDSASEGDSDNEMDNSNSYSFSPSELGIPIEEVTLDDDDDTDGVIISGNTTRPAAGMARRRTGEKPDDTDGVIISGSTRTASTSGKSVDFTVAANEGNNDANNNPDESVLPSAGPAAPRRRARHSHSMPMGRRGSVQLLLQSDEYCNAKFQRRMSSYATPVTAVVRPEHFRKRLGIRRSMDLSGEEIELYTRNGGGGGGESTNNMAIAQDDVDEFKAAVVMETIMTAADVAHNLQGWDQMVLWSGRLYLELRKAYVQNRGTDPQIRWFENQIGFLESYLLPLARRLEDTGVFGEQMGQSFATTVEANRDKWLKDGMHVTEVIVAQGAEAYKVSDA